MRVENLITGAQWHIDKEFGLTALNKYLHDLELINSGQVKVQDLYQRTPTIELNKPILLNCTYRDEEHNKKVGGEPNSLHKRFNAIDFRINGSFRELKEIYNHLVYWDSIYHFDFLPKKNGMGLGLYGTFIHIDTRSILGMKTPARWTQI